jgi:prophage regulatory protein
LVWLPELCEQLGRSKHSIERWVREGRFPKPIKITEQGCAWRLAHVEAWLAKLERSRKKRKPRGSLYRGDTLVVHSRKEAADA